MGVSENKGTPKLMVYNGTSYEKLMIWGYTYFWKHPYIYIYKSFDYEYDMNVCFDLRVAWMDYSCSPWCLFHWGNGPK